LKTNTFAIPFEISSSLGYIVVITKPCRPVQLPLVRERKQNKPLINNVFCLQKKLFQKQLKTMKWY
jgi:hypothetical protein